MKKLLLIGAIISSFAFANSSMMNTESKNTTNTKVNSTMIKNLSLTEAQQKELNSIKEACKKAVAPLKIMVEEKDLAIKKELLNDKPDWNKIEGILKEKSTVNAQMELIMLKTHNEIKNKFGIVEECNHMNMSKDMKHDMKM